MNIKVHPFKMTVLTSDRETAVALKAFARALPGDRRTEATAGLYPDTKGSGRFKVILGVRRMGLPDGHDLIKALMTYIAERKVDTLWRGDIELTVIADHAAKVQA